MRKHNVLYANTKNSVKAKDKDIISYKSKWLFPYNEICKEVQKETNWFNYSLILILLSWPENSTAKTKKQTGKPSKCPFSKWLSIRVQKCGSMGIIQNCIIPLPHSHPPALLKMKEKRQWKSQEVPKHN